MLEQLVKILDVVQEAAKEDTAKDTAKEHSDLLGEVTFNEMDIDE